jgi:hypothetical protein
MSDKPCYRSLTSKSTYPRSRPDPYWLAATPRNWEGELTVHGSLPIRND